jgi:large subunit ribosomal protein L25
MEQVSLRAEARTETGSPAARRLRGDGGIPAVIYGRGQDALNITVDRGDLYTALHGEAGTNALINLEVDKDSYLTVAREVQRHPVRGEITHLDFIRISLDEPISAEVAIEFMGMPFDVREGEGIVETVRNSVNLRALPMKIPGSIPLDISELAIGDTLTIGDLPDLEDVEYEDDPEAAVVTVVIPRLEIVEPEPEGEVLLGEDGEPIEVEEGEEGEGAEGGEEDGGSEDSGDDGNEG